LQEIKDEAIENYEKWQHAREGRPDA